MSVCHILTVELGEAVKDQLVIVGDVIDDRCQTTDAVLYYLHGLNFINIDIQLPQTQNKKKKQKEITE